VSTAVALATVLALVGSYVRAPEALLGVAFARACAAESAVTERSQPRLRVDHEDVHHVDDVDGLPAFAGSTKSVETGGERDGEEPTPVVLPAGHLVAADEPWSGERGLDWLPIGPPTRDRARLMVFLN
jgi:hypothetical protein